MLPEDVSGGLWREDLHWDWWPLMMSTGKIHCCHVIEGAPVVNYHLVSQDEGHDLPMKYSERVFHS